MMSLWVLGRSLWTLTCLLTIFTCINCDVTSEDFWKCDLDTFWPFSALQSQTVTSFMSCALWCGTSSACIGFNACVIHEGLALDCTFLAKNTSAELQCDSPLMIQVHNCTVTKKGQNDQKSTSETPVNQVPCSSHYGTVFETTHDGTVLYGNKSELIQRVRQGEEIRILLWDFNSKHQLFSTNQIIVNDQEVCAQSVFSVDQKLFFTRQILMICTSGFIQEQQWIIGSDMKERDVTALVKSTWFANGNCRTPVTSLHEMTSALTNGHDVMVLSHNNRFPLYGLYDVGTDIIAQFAWGVPRIDSVANKYTSNFDGNCVWQSRSLGFSGLVYNAKWQSGSGRHVENVTDTVVQMTWLTDSNWSLIYENSGRGESLYGSLSDLRDYTYNRGHRVRVVFNNQTADADFIFSHGGTVSAVFVRDLIWNIEISDDPLRQVVSTVTTAGRLQEYVYGLASSDIVSNTSTTIGVRWYVDVARWTKIFRVQNGKVDNNFPDILEDAITSGKAFRVIYIRPSGNMSFAGDSVTLSLHGIRVKSLLVNRIVDVTIESEQLVLYSPVGNNFYKFNSDGSVKIRIYDNGCPFMRSRERLLMESFSWFVSDDG